MRRRVNAKPPGEQPLRPPPTPGGPTSVPRAAGCDPPPRRWSRLAARPGGTVRPPAVAPLPPLVLPSRVVKQGEEQKDLLVRSRRRRQAQPVLVDPRPVGDP